MSTRQKLNWSLIVTLTLAVIGWLLGGFSSYAQVEHRITVVETQQSSTDRRLDRIEHKIDALLERR